MNNKQVELNLFLKTISILCTPNNDEWLLQLFSNELIMVKGTTDIKVYGRDNLEFSMDLSGRYKGCKEPTK